MAKIKGKPFFFYFKRSLNFLLTNKLIVIIYLFIEYIDIYANLVEISSQILFYSKSFNNNNQPLELLYYLSPFYHFNSFQKKNINKTPTYGEIAICIYFALLILYIVLYFISSDFSISKATTLKKFLNLIYINFYDYLFFRGLAIWGINATCEVLVQTAYIGNFEIKSIILFILVLLFLFVTICVYIKYFTTFCIWSTFKTHKNIFNNYPFDIYFSLKYDLYLLLLKVVISFSKNNLHFNKYTVDSLQLFINIMALIILYVMSTIIIYIFFFDKARLIFIMLNFTVTLRIVFIEFTAISVILKLMFHTGNNNCAFYFFLLISLLLLLAAVAMNYRENLIHNAENSSNLLGVSWFFQSNDLDRNRFISQWVLNHKATCNLKECEIFKEMYEEEEEIEPLQKMEESEDTPKETEKKIDVKFMTTLISHQIKNINDLNNDLNDDKTNNYFEKTDTILEKRANLVLETYSSFKFNNILLHKVNMNRNTLSKEDQIRMDFLSINVLFLENCNKQFKLFNTLNKYILKYKNNTNIFSCFMLIFDIIKKNNKEIFQNYKIIRKSDDLRNIIKKYIDDFDHFLHCEVKSPENFVSIANKYKYVRSSSAILKKLMRKKPESDYQLLLLRYMMELILHSQLKNFNSEFDLNYYEEFLEFHYLNDRYMLLQYSTEKKDFKIIQGSKKIMQFKMQPLGDIFPEYCREKGKEIFEDQLKSNYSNDRNLFEFIIKDLNHLTEIGYSQAFKMKYFVYPSNQDGDILILAHYIVDYSGVLIFETQSSYEDEKLFSLSSSMFKFLGLTPEMLQVIAKTGKFLTFSEIFHQPSLNIEKAANLCVFKYIRYARLYRNLMNTDGLSDCPKFSDCNERMKDICQFALEQKEVLFTVKEKFIIENARNKYIVYHAREYKPKGQSSIDDKKMYDFTATIDFVKNNLSITPEDDEDNQEQLDKEYNYENPMGHGSAMSPFSTNSVSVNSFANSQSSLFIKGRRGNNSKQKKIKYSQVSTFTCLIFFFGIFLLLVTLAFLILEIKQNSTFQHLFKLFQKFKNYKRGIDGSPLNILSNLCYYNKTNINCNDYYKEYSINMIKKFPSLASHPLISNLVNEEVMYKYDNSIIDNFNIFQREIFKLNFPSINKITRNIKQINVIVMNNYKISIEKNDITSLDLIRQYNNYINNIIVDKIYLRETIYFVSFNEDKNGLNWDMRLSQLSSVQFNIYLLILNYPLLHRAIIELSDKIEDEFSWFLNQLNLILMVFSIALLSLHIILCIICIYFLKIFIQMLKGSIDPVLILLNKKSFIDFIDKRLSALTTLCELYEENPIKLSEAISQSEEEYKKIQREEHKAEKLAEKARAFGNKAKNDPLKEQLSSLTDDNGLGIRKITIKDFSKIILKYRIVIITLFLVYVTYLVIYFIFLLIEFKKLKWLVDYCKIHTQIDNYIYENINSLQYLKFTNSSPYYLSEIILDDNSIDYVLRGINELYSYIELKEKIESSHKDLFPSLHSVINLNCSEYQIEDPLIKNAIDRLEGNYNKFISDLCSCFPVSTFGNENAILREILYLTKQMYNKYEQCHPETMKLYIKEEKIYDLLTLTLIIERINRKYFNENLFINEVDNIFNDFSLLIIMYLSLNMLLEILIFLILNFMVISRIKILNKGLVQFIHSLKF